MPDKSGLELLNDLIAELQFATAASAGPASAGPGAGAGAGAGGKKVKPPAAPKKDKPAVAPPAAPAALSVNSLDLRVGQIVSVQKHETAEKLYCEMIDIGEAEPRAIASGLVPHYTLEEMQGRRLIVVANLKPRNLIGFKSYGMVLCAAKEDPATGKEKVEFVDPPASAKLGARVVAAGLLPIADALSPSQVEKQKAFEVLAADLRVGSDGSAEWKGFKLTIEGSDEGCTAPTLRDAVVR